MKIDNLYIKVAMPIGIDSLFTYQISGFTREDSLIGRRVIAPFSNRLLTGVIVDFDDAPIGNYKIKPIYELLDDAPVFDGSSLRLAKWISEYYICPLGETLKAALPQGMSPKSVVRTRVNYEALPSNIESYFKNAPKRKELFMLLQEQNKPVSIDFLQKKMGITSVSQMLSSLETAGLINCEIVMGKLAKAKMAKVVILNADMFADDAKLLPHLEIAERKSPKRKLLISKLYELFSDGITNILHSDLTDDFSAPTIKSLEKLGIITIESMPQDRNLANKSINSLARRNEFHLDLTEEQTIATNSIINAIDTNKFKAFLLQGVTGSGKTLVYIRAIHHCISLGKSAMLLVPEIALTPQLIDRFEKVFPDSIAVFHSKMSEGERFDAWTSTRTGKSRIVIGARSAVFAPLSNLGLIIVDEEHESSYKQESPNPRYNARDTAIVRASFDNIVVVLGSATPSFESLHNATIGRYELLQILNRADGATMPIIKAIDTINSSKNGLMNGSFSKDMLEAIVDRISRREGVIIFQNRRGFASYLECPDCADIPTCKNCSVTLVYHRSTNQLCCHYCGFTAKAHRTCIRCGFPNMSEIGSGTQRIEDELAEYLLMVSQEARIERMDLDSTSAKGSHRAMLERFASGQTDILIGTQMVAKGLDFDRVTLVGVVNADIQLFLPDFRAGERTIQLLMQVSGRAGRSADLKGEVLIQTAHPNNPAVQAALANDYVGFFRNENVFRKNALYPPFSRFCVIEFTSEDNKQVELASKHFVAGFPRWQHYVLLGPIVPTIAKIRAKNRRIIIIKNLKEIDPKGDYLRTAIRTAIAKYNTKTFSAVKYTIDIDSFQGV